ncbi:M23 family metallopeptidase [Chryseobacterium arthrosphaerae]|uniref:M23 family metallopeptidase n=1 Tax=Chryseobacterium arthrosphaerae TaxID=651561 RepID=UPI0023E0AD1F|nr:M23 family metallopeptidase [Chryseobacterium arthrosphaerae]WES98339.1 M23 family metallopeptidase [Chryseobacterium arthrosphaerae]
MKSIKKYLIAGMILLCQLLVFGQFNTLTRKEIKPTESITEMRRVQKEKPALEKVKDNRNVFNKLFSTPTKSSLKKELDSLKTMMIRYSLTRIDDEKLIPKADNDSLVLINKNQSIEQYKNVEKPIKKFSFIKEKDFVSKISMPLDKKIIVTSPYGWRLHPIFRTGKMHNGTDLKANYENVYAVLDGVVLESSNSSGGGKYIKIRHSDAFVTSYLHLSEIYYEVGEYVKAGFIVAKSGNSGNSTGPHLHFAVQENGKYINPIRFLNDLINANNLIYDYYGTAKNTYSQQ